MARDYSWRVFFDVEQRCWVNVTAFSGVRSVVLFEHLVDLNRTYILEVAGLHHGINLMRASLVCNIIGSKHGTTFCIR